MQIRRLSPLTAVIAWFITIATGAVCLGPSKAHATCGDYLISHDHRGTVASQQPILSWLPDAQHRSPAAPCHGAGCRQAPDCAMTVLATSDRNRDTQVESDFSIGDSDRHALSWRRLPISDVFAARVHGSGLFRPPRPQAG